MQLSRAALEATSLPSKASESYEFSACAVPDAIKVAAVGRGLNSCDTATVGREELSSFLMPRLAKEQTSWTPRRDFLKRFDTHHLDFTTSIPLPRFLPRFNFLDSTSPIQLPRFNFLDSTSSIHLHHLDSPSPPRLNHLDFTTSIPLPRSSILDPRSSIPSLDPTPPTKPPTVFLPHFFC